MTMHSEQQPDGSWKHYTEQEWRDHKQAEAIVGFLGPNLIGAGLTYIAAFTASFFGVMILSLPVMFFLSKSSADGKIPDWCLFPVLLASVLITIFSSIKKLSFGVLSLLSFVGMFAMGGELMLLQSIFGK